MKILVAEDDPQSSEFLRKGLVQEGHSVDCVADGREALSYCLYSPCDVLILDRMMPGMDGLTVLKTLRAAGRRVPVLFLTSMGDVEDRVEGLLAGDAIGGRQAEQVRHQRSAEAGRSPEGVIGILGLAEDIGVIEEVGLPVIHNQSSNPMTRLLE